MKKWRARLQSVYTNFSEFEAYAIMYNLHTKLGYKTPESAWKRNPFVEGSVSPADYKKSKQQ